MLEQKPAYHFDKFRLDELDRALTCDGVPVELSGKAFDVLVLLAQNRGRLVEKDELLRRVWPDQIVEEANLTVQVSAIRKALGDRKENPHYIVTVPGHGYRFVGHLSRVDEEDDETVIERHTIERLTLEAGEAEPGAAGIVPANGSLAEITPKGHSDGRGRAVRSRALFLAGLATVLVAAGVFFVPKRATSTSDSASTAHIKSIAVLPFKPLVADGRDESLELGMTQALITRLGSLREIAVRPISAVRRYNGLEQDPISAGRNLQVEAVLDGMVQRDGDRLRVTVRFVRVADGHTLWTEQFDETFTNIFAVQDQVSEKVAGLLAVKLTGQEQTLLTKRYTDNPAAYDLYLKGGYFSNATVQEDRLGTNIEYFQQAIALDPNYAAAYVGLANVYMTLGGTNGIRSPRATFPKAKEAAMKALAIDETLADAHVVMASYKLWYEWNWPDAERELRRAIALGANDPAVHSEYGSYFQSMGRFDDALAERKLAAKFDPVSPGTIANVGYPLYYARRYDEAIEYFQRAIELSPTLPVVHLWIGQAYVQKRMYDEAIAEINNAIRLSGGGSVRALATLGHALASAGRRDEAEKVLAGLEQLSKQKYVSPYFIAVIYSGLGEEDQALRRLEQAYQERHAYMVLLNVEPVFDPIRSDPRFANLLRRVGIPS